MVDRARVIELFSPAGGVNGTGYLLAGDLILTAAHVVGDVDSQCEARPLGEPDWQPARVEWRGERCDAALVRLEAPASPTGPIRLGRFMAGTRAPCEGAGFPAAQQRPGARGVVRDTEEIKGTLKPLSGIKSGLLTIDLSDSSVPVDDQSGRSPWAGMSGSALFSGPLLIGVVHVHPANYGTARLMAEPMSSIAAEPGFRERLAASTGGDVVLEAVEEALTDALRPRLRPVLDAHPVFGGRDAELGRLDAFLAQQKAGYLFVAAQSGRGKTALLVHWLERCLQRSDGPSVAYTFITRGRDGLAEEDFTLRNLCQQLGWLRGEFGPLPGSTSEVRARYAKLLVERPHGQQVVVVLDGLDEASGWTAGSDLFPHHLPAGTHVVFSAREYAGRDAGDWIRELGLLDAGIETLPLTTLGRAEVERLLDGATSVPDWARGSQALDAMLDVSAGDPFYLRFLVEDLRTGAIASVEDLRARPTGLVKFFAEWWTQVSDTELAEPVLDLLGYLLVSLGPLSAADLVLISDDDKLTGFTFDRALDKVRRFVVGDAELGYALSHPRFQRYLAGAGGPLHDAASAYRTRVRQWVTDWAAHPSHYALTHVIGHLAEATHDTGGAARDRLVEQLAQLVTDQTFQRTHVDVVKDLPRLQRDLELALDVIARAESTQLEPVLSAAVGLEEFRRGWLRPEAVFHLAMSGRLHEAERRLALFATTSEDWRQVARLVIVWIGAELVSQQAALPEFAELKSRVAAELRATEPLVMLLQRIQWRLGERPQEPELRLPYSPFALPPAPPNLVAQQIVARIGGAADPETSISGLESMRGLGRGDDDAAPVYVAESDAPALVAFAAEHPGTGDDLLGRYIRVHASNPYAEYRNRSLWGVLGAAACHPDPGKARALVSTLAEAALAPPPVAFREGLRVTVEALGAGAGDALARERFEARMAQATSAAVALAASPPNADSWGNHGRRLATFAEAEALVLDRPDRAAALLAQARLLPRGFAGYRSSACLTLAEAHLVCNAGDVGAGEHDVQDALHAAHNIQEPPFCALRTARVNAMLARWWRTPIADPAAVIARFVADPLAAEFAPVHVVGETYSWRGKRNRLPLPAAMRDAATLREIADSAYGLPVSELRTLQPEIDPDFALDPDAEVAVPDPGFTSILAARLSAEALASPALTRVERAACIRRLVPLAADNPTAMHTVLTRLLLAAPPDDAGVLDAIAHLAPRDWMQEPAATDATEFGPA